VEEMVRAFLWWAGHCVVAFLSIISIFIGLRVISITARDPVNFILSLTLLISGVLLLIHFVGSMGKRIRERRYSE
jgi:multisubunit Na+/H+ antiporter MnhC subunit